MAVAGQIGHKNRPNQPRKCQISGWYRPIEEDRPKHHATNHHANFKRQLGPRSGDTPSWIEHGIYEIEEFYQNITP